MAPPILPSFKFFSYPAIRRPLWNTLHQESASGMDNPIPLWTFNKWQYELPINLLNSGSVAFQNALAIEWQALNAFYNQMQGSFGVFQFNDTDDNSVTNQLIGVGDGTTVAFPLTRTMTGAGGFSWNEPVFAPVSPQIFSVIDWQGSVLRYSTPRTNLTLQSNTFSNASWTKTNCTVTANSGTSPDGTNDAWQWQRSSVAAALMSQNGVKPATSLVYTFSMFAKPGTGNFLAFAITDGPGTNQGRATFNVSTGVISIAAFSTGTFSNASASIQPASNGFFRCTLTVTSNTDTAFVTYWSGNSNNIGIDGTDALSNTTILAFGAQLEQFNVATSYIATTTVAVTVTDYVLGTQGLVTFTTPPSGGSSVLWTGTFNWLCRFDDDNLDFSKFMNNLWEVKALRFTSIKTQSK